MRSDHWVQLICMNWMYFWSYKIFTVHEITCIKSEPSLGTKSIKKHVWKSAMKSVAMAIGTSEIGLYESKLHAPILHTVTIAHIEFRRWGAMDDEPLLHLLKIAIMEAAMHAINTLSIHSIYIFIANHNWILFAVNIPCANKKVDRLWVVSSLWIHFLPQLAVYQNWNGCYLQPVTFDDGVWAKERSWKLMIGCWKREREKLLKLFGQHVSAEKNGICLSALHVENCNPKAVVFSDILRWIPF